ncbi:MAG: YjfB family protein [Lachnospiraceae bacterium]|nr:YjfB family protein [Lachnospiraceae bacterium]
MALSQINTQSDIGTKLLSKAMDTNEAMGEGLVKMIDKAAMERSVNPAVGGNVDYSV